MKTQSVTLKNRKQYIAVVGTESETLFVRFGTNSSGVCCGAHIVQPFLHHFCVIWFDVHYVIRILYIDLMAGKTL